MPSPSVLYPIRRHAHAATLMRSLFVASLLLLASACAAPAPDSGARATGAQATNRPPQTATSQAGRRQHAPPEQAPPMSSPLPPVRRPTPHPDLTTGPDSKLQSSAAVQVDFSCNTDADCTVKNVGNCCGYYPRCVNKDSPTDPEAVQAQCAKSGMASVCGFQPVSSCQCVQGACEGSDSALIPQP